MYERRAGLEVTARKRGCIAAVVFVSYLYGEEDGVVIDPDIRGRETER
jgi:hypothetical protein